jgi:hypothetical protein
VSQEPYTPQGRTEGDEPPEPQEAPRQTPQARTDLDDEAAREGRPGDDDSTEG